MDGVEMKSGKVFYIVYKVLGGSFVPVYKSEVIQKTGDNYEWNLF